MYDLWEKADAFNPDSVSVVPSADSNSRENKKHFSIIMPPPNANDPLHVGHALFVTIEDIMIRYNRMMGRDTVWIPGTDHAGIETQFVFEKKLQKNKQSRFSFDRSTLFQMIWDYVQENSGIAVEQIKKLGASADWSRYKFTLDEDIVEDVLETFKQLHDDGLVYRDLRLVNYCTKCGTSYSELEVDHVDQTSPLYYVKYPFVDDEKKFITLATVRPEPIFADTHIAVNPTDKKHKDLIGKQVKNPLTGETMSIIGDEYVDPEFGTGIVKLTPAHDPNDFEIAKKYDLPIRIAFTPQGKLTDIAGQFAGLNIQQGRKAIVEYLEANGFIDHIDTKYQNRVGICYRCKKPIEPLPLPQFFIKVNDDSNSLVGNALAALDSGETKIHGAGREKILRHWLNNLKDWNISRQIVWGIGIPVWYEVAGNEDKIAVGFLNADKQFTQGTLQELLHEYSLEEITEGIQNVLADATVPYVVQKEAPPDGYWLQETDTFDTWFSSSQWPVVTLKNTRAGDFDRFYPTSVMETGYDILPFWVMRMMLLGIYKTGKSPFSDVYLHGLVRDQKGQKMSKSKGNVINPLEVVEKYGADALRMALVIRSTPGQDKSVGEPDFKAMRNLGNKLWNATRFVVMSYDASNDTADGDADYTTKLSEVVAETTSLLEKLQVGLAADYVYNEFWHWFCDECIEGNKNGKISSVAILEGITTFLKLLHPFAPFVTETIWQELRQKKLVTSELLITSQWPQ
ncbi:valine--tRNA ligase, partial [Candidatus Woesebacteria bacterium]|nr:valine--tRNA ligase [Candidatus Woesebacteria bacterium]